jgi:hypothetical protein
MLLLLSECGSTQQKTEPENKHELVQVLQFHPPPLLGPVSVSSVFVLSAAPHIRVGIRTGHPLEGPPTNILFPILALLVPANIIYLN